MLFASKMKLLAHLRTRLTEQLLESSAGMQQVEAWQIGRTNHMLPRQS